MFSCPDTCSCTTREFRKLKEIVDSGELGEVLYVYGNRQNLGKIRTSRGRTPESLGVHDLSVILLPARRGAVRGVGEGANRSSRRASRMWSSATCASPPGR